MEYGVITTDSMLFDKGLSQIRKITGCISARRKSKYEFLCRSLTVYVFSCHTFSIECMKLTKAQN